MFTSYFHVVGASADSSQDVYLNMEGTNSGHPVQEEYMNMGGLTKQDTPDLQDTYLPMTGVARSPTPSKHAQDTPDTPQEEYLNMEGLKKQHEDTQEDYENMQALHEQLPRGKTGFTGFTGKNGKSGKPKIPAKSEKSRVETIRDALKQQVPMNQMGNTGKSSHDYYNQNSDKKGYYNVFDKEK